MISITTKIASLVAVVVMAFSFLASGGSVSAAAKSPQYIRDELRLGYNTAIAMDWNNGVSPGIYPNPSCRQVIASRYSSWSGSKLYSNGDYGISPPAASASYRYDTWISGASKGNAVSPIAIGVNQQDVQLRINSLSFVCRPFANPVPPASCGLTGQQWIDRGGYWIYKDGISDTGVHDTGSSNYSNPRSNSCFINLKSWQKTQLVSLTATDGSIRGYTSGDVMTINKDAASRYWMTRKGIVYHSNSPITYAQYPNGKRITITMKYRQQNSYKNGVTTCKSSSGSGSATGTNNVTLAWSGCYTYTANLTFVLMPQKPPPPPST